MSWVLIKLLRGYQILVSPALHSLLPAASGCRFTPTCSQYALDAIRTRGAVRGVWLAAKRLARCHPWGGYGYDPVPVPVESRIANHGLRVTNPPSPVSCHDFHPRL